MHYPAALELAQELVKKIAPGCQRIEIVGSVKRADKPHVHDIEILVIPNKQPPRPEFGQKVIHLTMLDKVLYDLGYGVLKPVKNGQKYKQFVIMGTHELNPFYLDLFIVTPSTWGIQNVIRTGPRGFSHRFVTNKSFGGLLPDCYQYIRGETRIEKDGRTLDLPEEKDAIALLELGWIPPHARKKYASFPK